MTQNTWAFPTTQRQYTELQSVIITRQFFFLDTHHRHPIAKTLMGPSYLYNGNPIPEKIPDSKVHGANMGPIWDLSAPGGPHVGPINLVIRDGLDNETCPKFWWVFYISCALYALSCYVLEHVIMCFYGARFVELSKKQIAVLGTSLVVQVWSIPYLVFPGKILMPFY